MLLVFWISPGICVSSCLGGIRHQPSTVQHVLCVFSVAHELQPVVSTSLDTRGTRAHRTQDVTTPTTHTTRVGALPQSHPGLCGTPVGPGKDTHGTPVPEQGRLWVARQAPRHDDKQTTTRQRQVSRQTCCQRNQVLTHLETYMSGVPIPLDTSFSALSTSEICLITMISGGVC